MANDLSDAALTYHRNPRPGKIEVVPTKPLGNQRDLSLAYSPGVAAACEAIVADPHEAAALTARGNLVAVVTRSEEHTSELQSLMRISYAVFGLKKQQLIIASINSANKVSALNF